MQGNGKFIPILNFLRGIASFGVCAVHIHYAMGLYRYPLFSKIIKWGQQGPAIFFVISGFIIPYSLYNSNYELKNFFKYILKRSLRIDPPYLFSILLCFLAWKLASDFHLLEFFLHFFYLIPFSKYDWYNGVYWTLGIEFQYYIIIGLTFSFLQKSNIRFLIPALLFLSMVGYFIPIGSLFNKKDDFYITMHFHDFCMGIIVFLYKAERLTLKNTHLFLLLITLYLCKFISITTGAVGYISCLFILHINFKNVVTNFFGKISYSLYLIHLPIGTFVISILSPRISNIFILYILVIAACLLFAFVFNLIIETPSINWSKRIMFKKNI